jgi:hypothetical protein
MERDGKAIDGSSLRDTIDLPFWDGKGAYPNVKLRMDFRHIPEQEDGGM